MNSRIWRFGLVAVAAAALVLIGIVLLTGRDSGAQLSPSSSQAQTSENNTPTQTDVGTLVISRFSDPDHRYDLYLVRSDGTGLKRLTAGRGNEEQARWSPNGKRIVYVRSGPQSRIFVMNADGSGKVYLGNGESPSWSPGGERILYDNNGLWIMNADGSDRRVFPGNPSPNALVVDPSFFPNFATWAPNGKIVFMRKEPPDGDRPSVGGDLWGMDPGGSGLDRLTTGASMTWPSVSPDGSTIAAYATNTDRLITMPFRADGPAVTLLERASQYFLGGGNPAIGSRWSSDGKKLVLGSDNTGADGGVYIINADGSGLTRIPDVTQAREPDWRPAQTPQNATPAQSGTGTLVISSEPGRNYDLYLVHSDGTGLKQLTADPGDEGYAHWSPDGTRIVYASSGSRRSRSGIFVMNADGSGKLYLGDGASPSWSPDGRQILYERSGIDRLAVMNANGSGRRLVGVGAPFWPTFATWAPDGRIVFVRIGTSGDWSSGGDRPSLGGDLYAVDPDGSGLERLTKGARLTSPSVSPDGSTIAAYAAKTDRFVAVPYRADGPAVTLLERASQYFPTGGMPMISSRWSSDGKKLVLGSWNPWAGAGLYVVNADGSGITRVADVSKPRPSGLSLTTRVLTYAIDPDWRPE
jgi:TolB protein